MIQLSFIIMSFYLKFLELISWWWLLTQVILYSLHWKKRKEKKKEPLTLEKYTKFANLSGTYT